MFPERRLEILDLLLREIETAGRGGYAALVFFGEIRYRRCPPLGLRRQSAVSNIVRATGISLEELGELRKSLSSAERVVIKAARQDWGEVMARVWRDEIHKMTAPEGV